MFPVNSAKLAGGCPTRSAEPSPAATSRPTKKRRLEDKLCGICEEIDFLAFFSSTPPDALELGGLAEDFRSPSCPFCAYIKAIAREKLEDTLSAGQFIKVQQLKVPASEHLRTSDVAPAYRLELFAKLASNKKVPLAALDLCGSHPYAEFGNNAFRMARTPRESYFRIDMLLSWLGTSRQNAKHRRTATSAAEDEPLLRLIKQERLRVLDVLSYEVIALRKPERYVALSYVWGESNAAAAIQDLNDQASLCEVDHGKVVWKVNFDRTPRTIRDAAEVVKQLGDRYLWIDSICIDQNDKIDKANIISEMNSIYREAFLTIVAAEGSGADAGLGRIKASQEAPEHPVVFTQRDKTICLLASSPDLERTLQTTTWNERGWTYQERVLSTKCVYFTRQEVFFTGPGITEREAYVLERKPVAVRRGKGKTPTTGKRVTTQEAMTRPNDSTDVKFAQYRHAVEAYTARKLSHKGDRLDAFSGVLDSFVDGKQEKQETQALSGLVRLPRSAAREMNCFTASLLWQPKYPLTKSDRIETNAAGTRALPSWSWAGWSCAVRFEHDFQPNSALVPINIDDTNIQCIDLDAEGRNQWPYEPEPCNMTMMEGIVLHLWCPVLQCMLKPVFPKRRRKPASTENFRTYKIVWPSRQKRLRDVGIIDVAHDFVLSDADDTLYDFVLIGTASWMCSSSYSLLLVQRDGRYFKRVALCRWDDIGFIGKYGMLWRQESVHMDEFEFQHVKLI